MAAAQRLLLLGAAPPLQSLAAQPSNSWTPARPARPGHSAGKISHPLRTSRACAPSVDRAAPSEAAVALWHGPCAVAAMLGTRFAFHWSLLRCAVAGCCLALATLSALSESPQEPASVDSRRNDTGRRRKSDTDSLTPWERSALQAFERGKPTSSATSPPHKARTSQQLRNEIVPTYEAASQAKEATRLREAVQRTQYVSPSVVVRAGDSQQAASSTPEEPSSTLTTRDGTTYEHAMVLGKMPDALLIKYTSASGSVGVAQLKFEQLPFAMQQRYGYSPQEAAAYAAEARRAEAQRQAQRRAEELAATARAAERRRAEGQLQAAAERRRAEVQRSAEHRAVAAGGAELAASQAPWPQTLPTPYGNPSAFTGAALQQNSYSSWPGPQSASRTTSLYSSNDDGLRLRSSPLSFYSGSFSDGRCTPGRPTEIGAFGSFNARDSDGNWVRGSSTRIGQSEFYHGLTSDGRTVSGSSTQIGGTEFYRSRDSDGNTVRGTSTRIGQTEFIHGSTSDGRTISGSSTQIGDTEFYHLRDSDGNTVRGTSSRTGQ